MHQDADRLANRLFAVGTVLGATLASLGALGLASRVSAQALVASDLIGFPLRLVETPVLTPGVC